MAFDHDEYSIEDGKPIRLYRFSLGDKFWRYTNADQDINKAGEAWLAVPITDDGINQTGEASTDVSQITATSSIVPSQIYMQYPPSRNIQVAIFSAHEDSPDVRRIYMGEITGHNIPTVGTALLTCETLGATLTREGLRLGWQRACPYALYDPVTCKANKSAYAVGVQVTSMTDNILVTPAVAGYPQGHFSGGFVEWMDPVRGIERRGIENHFEGFLTMFGTADGIEIGMNLIAYPGCSRNTDGCKKFNNLPNYGGAPGMQGKSPFDGTPVFN